MEFQILEKCVIGPVGGAHEYMSDFSDVLILKTTKNVFSRRTINDKEPNEGTNGKTYQKNKKAGCILMKSG